jgi:hypothetical protein
MTGAFYALELMAMRHVRLWRWHGEPTGQAMVRWIPAIAVLMLLLRVAAPPLGIALPMTKVYTWCSRPFQNLERARVLAQLRGLKGRQLVIVRYGPHHYLGYDWVYNEADIDQAKVVWARDMGTQNEELIRSFGGGHVWLLEADADGVPPKLSPLPGSVEQASGSSCAH